MRLLLFILILCLPGAALGNARLPVGCSAALFKMEGMTLDQKALILTAGHCANLGSFSHPAYTHTPPTARRAARPNQRITASI